VPHIGRLGALLVEVHHDFDPQRFLPATERTQSGYGSFLQSQLDSPDAAIFIAEDDGRVIGYGFTAVEGYDYVSLRGPAGIVHDILVDPGHRGRGAGRRLMDAMLDWLRSRGVPRVVLSTAERNEAAQRLFASLGFRRTMVEMTREL
jgi:ribosomal protein S18 acetylase RimI-like enzyme